MATSEKDMDTKGCDDHELASQIIKIFNDTSECLDEIELASLLKNVDLLGKEKNLSRDQVKQILTECTELTLFKEGMTVHLTKQTVRSLIALSEDYNLWQYVWKDISRLARPLIFSVLDDRGEIDPVTLPKDMDLLQNGTENVRHIRLMVVGMFGVGKTTIIRRLCNHETTDVISTVGIDVSVNACEVDDQKQWKVRDLKTKPKTYSKTRIRSAYRSGNKRKESPRNQEKKEVDYVLKKSSPKPDSYVEIQKKEDVSEYNQSEKQYVEVRKNEQSRPKADQTQKGENVIKKFEDKDLVEDVRGAFDDESEDQLDSRLTTVSIWDFAGQSIYYSTHHFFLSARAIYLLVLDISKRLSDKVPEDKLYENKPFRATSMPKGFTCLDAFKFWMNSIFTYTAEVAAKLQGYRPKIVLVGTFKDKVIENNPEESKEDGWLEQYKENYFNEALKEFNGTEVLKLVHSKKYFVCKDDPTEIFDALKEDLTSIAEKQPFWNESIPIDWIPLERAIKIRKDEKTRTNTGGEDKKSAIMELHELEKIDKGREYPLSHKETLKLFLNFQHALGNVLYYDTKRLEDNIILDPQWILDVFKLFVTHVKEKQPTQSDEWSTYENNAILSHKLMNELIKHSGNESFHDYRGKIIHYMEYLDVIAKPVTFNGEPYESSSSEEEEEISTSKKMSKDFYIVPCLLSQKPPEEILKTKIPKISKSTPILCLVFKNKFLPAFVCHRLMATCIRKWEVPFFNEEQLMLFNGMGRFFLNSSKTRWLDLRWKDYILYMQIFQCSKKGKKLEEKTCNVVREQIQEMIRQIFSIHRRYTGNVEDKQYDVYIKCPKCNAEEQISAKFESDTGCARLSDMINVKRFEKSEEVNCANYHSITRDDALSCWYFEENQEYKDRWLRSLREKVSDCLQGRGDDSEVTDRQIMELSECIGKEYIALGIELGLTAERIEQIELGQPDVKTRIKDILMEWKKIQVIPSTVDTFKHAFGKIIGLRFMDDIHVDRSKEIVKWYEQKVNPEDSPRERDRMEVKVSEKMVNPDDSPQERDLIEVIHLVGRKYGRLAKELFERNMYAEIEQIEMQYSLDFNRTLAVLLKWKKESKNVTFLSLKDCLVKIYRMKWEETKKKIADDEQEEARKAFERITMEDRFPRHFQKMRQNLDDGNSETDMEEGIEDTWDSGMSVEYSSHRQIHGQTQGEETMPRDSSWEDIG